MIKFYRLKFLVNIGIYPTSLIEQVASWYRKHTYMYVNMYLLFNMRNINTSLYRRITVVKLYQ